MSLVGETNEFYELLILSCKVSENLLGSLMSNYTPAADTESDSCGQCSIDVLVPGRIANCVATVSDSLLYHCLECLLC